MTFGKGEMSRRPEENRDLTIRRLDGSYWGVALPVWFDQTCHVIQGKPEGKINAVYIVPPSGPILKLNQKTRRFENSVLTVEEKKDIDFKLDQIRAGMLAQSLKRPEVPKINWFKKLLRIK